MHVQCVCRYVLALHVSVPSYVYFMSPCVCASVCACVRVCSVVTPSSSVLLKHCCDTDTREVARTSPAPDSHILLAPTPACTSERL